MEKYSYFYEEGRLKVCRGGESGAFYDVYGEFVGDCDEVFFFFFFFFFPSSFLFFLFFSNFPFSLPPLSLFFFCSLTHRTPKSKF